MIRIFCATTICFLLIFIIIEKGFSRDWIQISGSSTVLPYAKIVAETFGEIYPNYKIPVIESGGTGAGMKEFCRGVGEHTIDIVNASRPMKLREKQACTSISISTKDIGEFLIGYDGIVFATDINGPSWKMKAKDLYRAFAEQHVVDGRLQSNHTKKWNEISSVFPNWDIAAYIPGEKHGTREVFEEKLMLTGCRESGAFELLKKMGLSKKAVNAACIAVRKDGKIVDVDGDYAETLARVRSNKTSIGVFGFSFYKNNIDLLKVASVNGIIPNERTIASGQYSLSRPLYFYVKKPHFDTIAGLKEYVELFLSEHMTGEESPLQDYGLVAVPEGNRALQRSILARFLIK